VSRHRIEFEIAVKDSDRDALDRIAQGIDRLVHSNVPAQSGWALTRAPAMHEVSPVPQTHPKPKWTGDKRWEAIQAKIAEMIKSGKPLSMRGTAMESAESGAAKPRVYCHVKLYDDKTCTTKSLYIIRAYENTVKFRGELGAIIVEVDGPYEDAADEYWIEQSKNREDAIVTEDWVHRRVHKDDPKAVAAGGGGHGGAKFRFVIMSDEQAERFEAQGLKVEDYNHDGEDWYLLTTHNCWYQGVIPRKHRHLFEVNAKMVSGFDPSVNVL